MFIYLRVLGGGEKEKSKEKKKKGKTKRLWTHKYTNRRKRSLLWRVWVRVLICGSSDAR